MAWRSHSTIQIDVKRNSYRLTFNTNIFIFIFIFFVFLPWRFYLPKYAGISEKWLTKAIKDEEGKTSELGGGIGNQKCAIYPDYYLIRNPVYLADSQIHHTEREAII